MSTREKFPEFSHLVLPQKAQEQLQKMSAELRRRQESLLSHPFFAEGKGFLKFFWDIPSKKGGRPKSVAAKHHTELGAFERQINRKFTLDGAIKSVSDPKTGPYASFFEVHGRSTIIRGKYILRGARYSTAIDAGHDETQRYDNYFQDFVDGLSVLTAEQKKIETEAHFFEKQAVLDYVKNASVSLLNALMADERDGNFPEDETALTHYLDTRKSLEDIARSSVFAQYAHLAGDKETLDKELTTLFKKVTTLKKAIGVLRSLHKKDPYKRRTGVRELTHPLHIAGAALHTVTTGATRLPETILGLPTGSTEYAYALQYAFEHLEQRRPNVILAPLSLHNARKVSATTNTMKALGDPALAVFLKHYRRNIDGKNLLVVDDNSSSGETLDTIKQTLANFFNPKHIEASVAQVDTRRGEHLAQRAVRKPTKDAHLRVSTPESLKMSVSNLHMSRVLKKNAPLNEVLFGRRMRESLNVYSESTVVNRIIKNVFLKNVITPTMHTLQAYLNERAMLGEDKRKAQRLRAIRQQYAEVSLFKRLTEETDEKVVKRLESEYTLAKRERDTEYEKMKDSKMANALLSMESKLGRARKNGEDAQRSKVLEVFMMKLQARSDALAQEISLDEKRKEKSRKKQEAFILDFNHPKYSFLSNFYMHPVVYKEIAHMDAAGLQVVDRANAKEFPSSEHAYQAAKFPYSVLKKLLKNEAARQKVFAEINNRLSKRGEYVRKENPKPFVPVTVEELPTVFSGPLRTCGEVKMIARILSRAGYEREDWTRLRVRVMTEILLEKFSDPALKQKLLDTYPKTLVEMNSHGDTFYGVVDNKGAVFGRNFLGLILMEVRDHYRKEQELGQVQK